MIILVEQKFPTQKTSIIIFVCSVLDLLYLLNQFIKIVFSAINVMPAG